MKLSKLVVSALAGGAILLSGNAMAATGDGANAFRDAYLASPTDNRVFVNGANVVGPYFHADIAGKGKMLADGTLQWEGAIEWVYTNKNTNVSTNEKIPIYIEQSNGAMNLYAYRKNQWAKLALPGISAGVVNAIKTTDPKQLNTNMDAVKSAQIVEDSADVRKIRLTLDGKKIAAILQNSAKNNINNLSGSAYSTQQIFINRIATGLMKSDISLDWGVNKSTNQTVTLNLDATPIISGYAKAILDEKFAGKITLTDEETRYYTALGYYISMPAYISIVGADSADLKAPQNLGSIRYNSNVFSDLRQEIVSTPMK